jgi:dolichol-phosphate mannosyltransferase
MRPDLSVVIPTRNEEGNIADLLKSLDRAMTGIEFETIFADDSTDCTADIAETAGRAYRFDVRVLRRAEPTGGLGGAVVEGIKLARAEFVLVMDADFQHPPALAPVLYRHLRNGEADVVVASRYVAGGDPSGLTGTLRRVGSRSAGLLGRAFFPRRLKACTDPMTGFFCVRLAALDVASLRPQGFKILLEMIVRSGLRVAEVPMVMGSRAQGLSKAGLREASYFLRQLFVLRFRSAAARFALVGLTGAVWNLAIIAVLTGNGVTSVASTLVAVQIATAWNFVGTESLVFHDRRARTWRHRALAFEFVGATDLVRLPFVLLLIRSGIGPVVATALTLVAAFGVRYMVTSKLIYRRKARALVPVVPESGRGVVTDVSVPSAYAEPSWLARATASGS